MANYPFGDMAAYPRNQWYLAAWSDEIGRSLLARTILGRPLVFFRTLDGRPIALPGLCPHRWMPFDKGRLEGDLLVCGYHGLTVDADGRCRSAPGNRPAPDDCRLPVLPLIERPPCLWIWPGDAALADAAFLPDTDAVGLTGDGWHVVRDPPIRVAARAQLILENLFDQSHIASVHRHSLAGGNALPEPGTLAIEDTPHGLRVGHEPPALPADAATRALFDGAGPYVRARLSCALLGVSLVNSVGSQTFNATAAGDFLNSLGHINFLHGVTPETPRSAHYFAAHTRDFRRGDLAVSASLMQRNRTVVREDIAILEAIEPGLDPHADPRGEWSFASDGMAMRLRRRIARLIRAEGGNGDAPP